MTYQKAKRPKTSPPPKPAVQGLSDPDLLALASRLASKHVTPDGLEHPQQDPESVKSTHLGGEDKDGGGLDHTQVDVVPPAVPDPELSEDPPATPEPSTSTSAPTLSQSQVELRTTPAAQRRKLAAILDRGTPSDKVNAIKLLRDIDAKEAASVVTRPDPTVVLEYLCQSGGVAPAAFLADQGGIVKALTRLARIGGLGGADIRAAAALVPDHVKQPRRARGSR